MKTKEKILETLLKIQELVESIVDNQHRPNAVFYNPYSLPIPNWNNDNEEQKPFPEYWWTYTEGLPDVIKDWFVKRHRIANKWYNDYKFIGHRKNFGNYFMIDFNHYLECEYVTHQQIIDHYGLEGKPQKVNLMDYTKKEEVKIEPDEQPKKLYTKKEIVNLYDRYLLSDNQPAYSFARWLRDNL